jgi:bifunctional DNA-binding transcriptional regulator/antitoxin component of YhaV-PrlF toxin-antitoxin module
MITTIDAAGRIVIPLPLRKRFHFTAKAEIEIIPVENGIHLRLPQREARFIDKDGVLVQQGDQTAPIDATAFINDLREGRSLDAATHQS